MPTGKFKKAGKPVEQMIVDAIIQHIKPKRIILFGSRARDDVQARSDYDIAIDDAFNFGAIDSREASTYAE